VNTHRLIGSAFLPTIRASDRQPETRICPSHPAPALQRDSPALFTSGDAANVLRGEVKAIIEPTVPGEAEKVQIAIQTGEEPNQEIRIANTLTNAQAETGALKKGAALHLGISLSNLSRKLQPNIPRIPVRNLCGNSPNKSVKPAGRATLCPQLSRSWL
jgi:hypothetical protein